MLNVVYVPPLKDLRPFAYFSTRCAFLAPIMDFVVINAIKQLDMITNSASYSALYALSGPPTRLFGEAII